MENTNSFQFKKVDKLNLDKYNVPPYLEEVLSEFIAKLVKTNPDNAYLFALNYFDDKLKKHN
ncbi:conserved Plasmodium protein, unknown function [Plasmodium knowlesi strain H]|uniref:RIIa domain-containing protein n=3 Tax=Plasmodium knowlesi TaxID=5850 RepID=A0A5K1UXZ1_PLAKH|nr:conserved Plasmodium protein, unknown function [Plasmodium knowlesi strain H]CAA9988065.1 conserved Plasmodium protein, unknown function [Plasmodium knowlesi strain H]SBO19921.1 conserved Plasmodium protein, unknown function [Plasmodium knowlesi strain H]SBO29069.1 conserved Plasmodium protein, unknown function [Plasmodium knowlesi strain H]VVS77539.1 conserved Plasmodium protein, unknown function [Plasmodium knowlesi strain H]|eukprot:XP_002259039.1 hypothetical protein, conserved in Plasmodium species [Plasmodium knowlesi strain H]